MTVVRGLGQHREHAGADLSVEAGRYMFYSESESRSFITSGKITLEDGQSIDFTLSLRQSQSRITMFNGAHPGTSADGPGHQLRCHHCAPD